MVKHVLEAKGLATGYDSRAIIENLNLQIPDGKISVIIGANGCGKSTLLKSLSRLNRVMKGGILLDGRRIHEYPSKQLAKELGLLPQSPVVPEGISVTDLVSRGRFPYRSFMKGMGKDDYRAVLEALETMGIEELADRSVDELSGGQRQRVWIALALAQQTDILLLDEPTTFLDISYQVEILDLLTDLNRRRGTTIVMVLHDINLSARYADYLFAMKNGKLIAEGAPSAVISPELVREVFGLNCSVIRDPVAGSPMIVPIGRHYRGQA